MNAIIPPYRHHTPTQPYTLSLHDALPIFVLPCVRISPVYAALPKTTVPVPPSIWLPLKFRVLKPLPLAPPIGSEALTSELQSRFDLVCRVLLEKNMLIVALASVSTHGLAS